MIAKSKKVKIFVDGKEIGESTPVKLNVYSWRDSVFKLLEGKDEKIKAQVNKYIELMDSESGVLRMSMELLSVIIIDSMEKMKKDDSEI